ncbi:protein NLP6-like isoform X2 [Rhododendron vialii]|uniref:protein NLP6-like isoform X2 n=1 Tax=Rhododendron vialii TaxID=182163 RepID=UPI00265E3568|nr:protein NLP6-like isoform X2 [Rhododendron vialii]
MEGANQSLLPVISSVDEIEELPPDFGLYLQRELNWSRLEDDDDGEPHRVTGWVFWSRQDDKPRHRLPVSGYENLVVSPDSSPTVKDKIRLALGRIVLHPRFGQSLVQYWAATTTTEGRTLLTTQNQPCAVSKMGKSTWGLCEYRMKSMEYKFYGDIGEEELGLPGRVFLYKLPESAADVQYYSVKEYPQRDDASRCQVRASWALPVFEHSSQICVGVLELVSTVDAITDWYHKSFLCNLHDVFQELGLQSIDVYKHYQMKYKDEDKTLTSAFHELALVLESVSKIHKLPLALTWVPCSACDSLLLGRLSSEGGEYLGAFEANNNHLVDFLIANTGYHLPKGEVAERVLSFPNMLYCKDVTQFSIAEYPLVPFARHCKLSGWFTICLHSSYTGEDVYILEFFLPKSGEDNENTLTTVDMILRTIKENFKTCFRKRIGRSIIHRSF